LLLPISLIGVFINNIVGFGTQVSAGWLIWIIFGGFFLSQISNTAITSFNLWGKRVIYVIVSNIVLWGGLLLSVVFIRNLENNAEWWYSGTVVIKLFLLVLLFPSIVFKLQKKTTKHKVDISSEWESLWQFSSPLIVYSFVYFLQYQSYPFLFGFRADVVSLGLFSVGLNLGLNPMRMFSNLFEEYYNPIFYSRINSNPEQIRDAWNQYVKAYLPAIIAFGFFVIGISPLLAKILLGSQFQSVAWLAIWGVILQVCVVSYSLLNMASHAFYQTKLMIMPTILGAFFTVGLLSFLLPIDPLLGGAIAVLTGAFINLVGMAWQIKKVMPVSIPWKLILIASTISAPYLVTFWGINLVQGNIYLVLAFVGMVFYALIAQLFLGKEWLRNQSQTLPIE